MLMFERFTDRARRVIVLAQDEARRLNHNYVGTEHILLGLLAEGEGVAAKALDSLDVDIEAVRDLVEGLIDKGKTAPGGPIPYTPRAKKVLELALREALELGHNYIGTEHILLGIIREGEGVGANAMVNLGVDLNKARAEVIKVLNDYQTKPEPEPTPTPVPTLEVAYRTLQGSVDGFERLAVDEWATEQYRVVNDDGRIRVVRKEDDMVVKSYNIDLVEYTALVDG